MTNVFPKQRFSTKYTSPSKSHADVLHHAPTLQCEVPRSKMFFNAAKERTRLAALSPDPICCTALWYGRDNGTNPRIRPSYRGREEPPAFGLLCAPSPFRATKGKCRNLRFKYLSQLQKRGGARLSKQKRISAISNQTR